MKNTLNKLSGVVAIAIIALVAMYSSASHVKASNPTGYRGQVSQSAAPQSTEKASDLIGMEIYNFQGKRLGSVDNLMVDLAAGSVVAVIMTSAGDFSGRGNFLSAIPPSVLTKNAGQDNLLLDLTSETLAALPHFTNNEWPVLSQPDYIDGVYRAYQVPPYYVVARTVAQVARAERIALNPQRTVVRTRDRTAIIRIGPMTGEDEKAVEVLREKIARAEASGRPVELVIIDDDDR